MGRLKARFSDWRDGSIIKARFTTKIIRLNFQRFEPQRNALIMLSSIHLTED